MTYHCGASYHSGTDRFWRKGYNEVVDEFGDHFIACQHSIGPHNNPRRIRHNRVMAVFDLWLKRAGYRVKAEIRKLGDKENTSPYISISQRGKVTHFIEICAISGKPASQSVADEAKRGKRAKEQ